MKAFVQVSSHEAAEAAIDNLHCQLLNLGKTKVFVSNKAAVNYNMSIAEVLKLRGGRPRSPQLACAMPQHGKREICRVNYDSINEKGSQERTKTGWDSERGASCNTGALNVEYKFKERRMKCQNTKSTNGDTSCAVNKLTYKKGVDAEQCSIKVTHSNVHELDSKKISKLFRRYGRLLNLAFDYEKTFWRITYSSPKDVQKVVKASEKDKLFGYELYDYRASTSVLRACDDDESCGTREIVKYLSRTEKQSDQEESVILRIDVTDGYIGIEEMCKMIAKVYMPIELAQAYDILEDGYFFLAKFVEYEQAGEVLFVLNSVDSKNCSINARFR